VATGQSTRARAGAKSLNALAPAGGRTLPQLRFNQSIRTISEVVHWLDEDKDNLSLSIELCPAYQRGAVWDEERKVNLIKSVLMGLPIGGIYVNNRDSYGYSEPLRCVDGQQRLRALAAFINGEFAIPTEWVDDRAIGDARVVPEDYEGESIRYSDFNVPGQRFFGGNTIAVMETQLETEREEAELFLLVNFGGVAQTGEDLARASAVADRVGYNGTQAATNAFRHRNAGR
jgi:hypothetical protein